MTDCIGTYSVQPVFSVEQIREIERQLFSHEKSSFAVMEQAAASLYKNLLKVKGEVQHVTILVGGGNNGGDGLVLAALLIEADYDVRVLDCATKKRKGDALKAYKLALSKGVDLVKFQSSEPFWGGVVVDGLSGIGVELPLREDVLAAVHWINDARDQGAFVLAIDLPTGVDADTGYAKDCVMADLTVSMIQRKPGNLLGAGSIATGQLIIESLGSSALLPEHDTSWLDVTSLAKSKPCPRYKNGHKGRYGHIAVFGGDYGYGGAAIMASEAASKVGAGTISLVTREEHVSASLARNPNVMVLGDSNLESFQSVCRKNTVVVVGPGLGRGVWGRQMFERALALSLPTVLDADALYWLAQSDLTALPENCVLTPHLGEAARLLGCSIEEVERDPIESCLAISKNYLCTTVLKGVASVVANVDGRVFITGQTCPVLSKGGSGDVLSGIIAATQAYYSSSIEAAVLAVAWHNYAAREAAKTLGEHRAQPYDLLDFVD